MGLSTNGARGVAADAREPRVTPASRRCAAGCLEGERVGGTIRVFRRSEACSCTLDLAAMDLKSARLVARILAALS